MAKDYYSVLGVSKNATQKEIKKAFRKLAKENHPDAGGDETKFKEINEAYDVLGNEEKRKQYDAFGTMPPPGTGGNASGGYQYYTSSGMPFDFDFSSYGGGTSGINIEDILKDILNDGSVGGSSGYSPFSSYSSRKTKPSPTEYQVKVQATMLIEGGKISITSPLDGKKVIVNIKPLTLPGTKMKVGGKGDTNSFTIELLNEDDEKYEINGKDITMSFDVPFTRIAVGGKQKVKLPNGKTVSLTIPEKTTSASSFSVKDGGYAGGKCILVPKIIVPNLTADQKKAIKEIDSKL